MKILVVNGPNLNLTGKRNKEHYGSMSLGEINRIIRNKAKELGVKVKFYQSNHEGRIIDKIQRAKVDGLLLNLGAFSHYSWAIRDCVEAKQIEACEVHLSDIFKREEFRQTRVLDGVVSQIFAGKRENSYLEGFDYIVRKVMEKGK